MLTVRARTADDLPAVRALLAARADRLRTLDDRLDLLADPGDSPALVAVDASGVIRGHVRPERYELATDDEMRAFGTDRGTRWEALVGDDEAVTALAAALRHPTAGCGPSSGETSLRWPSADAAAVSRFATLGLGPTFVYARRPPLPLPAGAVPGARARIAGPADERALVALHLEEIAFHTAYTPYVRVVPAVEPAFRQRLALAWGGGDPATDFTSLLVVAETGGEVVGFAESWLQVYAGELRGYLNSVGVRADRRGHGLGRLVAATTIDLLLGYGAGDLTLWYAAANPVSSRVWPRLGFVPLWTVYFPRPGAAVLTPNAEPGGRRPVARAGPAG